MAMRLSDAPGRGNYRCSLGVLVMNWESQGWIALKAHPTTLPVMFFCLLTWKFKSPTGKWSLAWSHWRVLKRQNDDNNHPKAADRSLVVRLLASEDGWAITRCILKYHMDGLLWTKAITRIWNQKCIFSKTIPSRFCKPNQTSHNIESGIKRNTTWINVLHVLHVLQKCTSPTLILGNRKLHTRKCDFSLISFISLLTFHS